MIKKKHPNSDVKGLRLRSEFVLLFNWADRFLGIRREEDPEALPIVAICLETVEYPEINPINCSQSE
jgi:hypothetical protein